MKKIVSLLLSLLMICVMTAATAETTGVMTSRGGTLTLDVVISAGGSSAKIGIKTNSAPVTFVSAVGGSVNDTVPPQELADCFVVTNMDGVTISPDGKTLSGSLDSFKVGTLQAGTIGTLTVKVNDDAAYGTYTIEVYKVQGDCTVEGTLTFTVTDRIPGDADNNGTVTTNDALIILQYFSGFDVTINTANANCDGDTQVTTNDALRILQYFSGFDVTLQ